MIDGRLGALGFGVAFAILFALALYNDNAGPGVLRDDKPGAFWLITGGYATAALVFIGLAAIDTFRTGL